ncbi:hypothetical protein FN846DRAFT_990631 [Sphaerosporella brunnea]|uniref:Uncharacterized protein n=1 Tax=Sphaerosporella brunnea TaxID=1250544 RepID=A0A5J5ENY1_9PEZI|nr:hypothetical protein FN846DRAFT_990631 [Sphaerosporella brunnea]
MATRTSHRPRCAVLAEATTIDISLIGTKRDGESLQVERIPKRLRNDDQERCDAIDTIGSTIVAQVGLADDAVFRTVTVTGREPAITEVSNLLSDALHQYAEPATTQGLTHEEETNYERVLREVLVAFTRICGGKHLSHSYWQNIARPTQTDLMQHLLSAPHLRKFIAFAGGDERKLRDMISLYNHPTLFSRFSKDVHTVTVQQAIDAVAAWLANHKDGARTLRKMLQFELNVPSLWDVLDTDRGKDLHEHVQSINERRYNNVEIKNIARAFNESSKQKWIQDAEEAKLLVTYNKYEAAVADLSAKDRQLEQSIQTLAERDTVFARELETVRADFTTRNTELATELATVRADLTARTTEWKTERSDFTTRNTELATELATVRADLTARTTEWKTERSDFTTRNNELATELATVRADLTARTTEWKTERSDFTTRITAQDAVNSNLTSRITELQTENTALASELATTKEEVKALNKTVADLAQTVNKLLAQDRSVV